MNTSSLHLTRWISVMSQLTCLLSLHLMNRHFLLEYLLPLWTFNTTAYTGKITIPGPSSAAHSIALRTFIFLGRQQTQDTFFIYIYCGCFDLSLATILGLGFLEVQECRQFEKRIFFGFKCSYSFFFFLSFNHTQ